MRTSIPNNMGAMLNCLPVLVLFVGTPAPSIASDPIEAVEDRSTLSIVYAYGNPLSAPYEFSHAGSDTLLLNGYPYVPTRSSRPRQAAVDTETTTKNEQAEGDFQKLREEAWREAAKASNSEDAYAAFVNYMRASPLVEWADRNGETIAVKLRAIAVPIAIYDPLNDPSPKEDKSNDVGELHSTAIADFNRDRERGSFIAFGNGYHISSLVEGASSLIQEAERLRGGGEQADTRKRSPAEKFYRDVVAALSGQPETRISVK